MPLFAIFYSKIGFPGLKNGSSVLIEPDFQCWVRKNNDSIWSMLSKNLKMTRNQRLLTPHKEKYFLQRRSEDEEDCNTPSDSQEPATQVFSRRKSVFHHYLFSISLSTQFPFNYTSSNVNLGRDCGSLECSVCSVCSVLSVQLAISVSPWGPSPSLHRVSFPARGLTRMIFGWDRCALRGGWRWTLRWLERSCTISLYGATNGCVPYVVLHYRAGPAGWHEHPPPRGVMEWGGRGEGEWGGGGGGGGEGGEWGGDVGIGEMVVE